MSEPALTVLFVCTANICRSPYAALRAPAFVPAGRGLRCFSAGIPGSLAEPMSAEMGAVLRARGGEPSGHRSQPVTGAVLDAVDVVLTMEAGHRRALSDNWIGAAPKIFTMSQFAAAAQTEPCQQLTGRQLVGAVSRARAPVGADVADPYGRGPAANAAAADLIDALLRRIVPRLSVPVESA